MKNLLITGDSLSYNRHCYDSEPRENAADCHIGMNSWSFRLRNKFITSAKGFRYGDELKIKEPTEHGMAKNIDIYDSIFGGRVVTVTPRNGMIHIEAESDTGTLVLYLQKRKENYCRFDLSVDGVSIGIRVDTCGNTEDHQGYGLLTIKLPCEKNKKIHEVVFSNFEYTEKSPLVTVAGMSDEERYAYVTGQGSRTAKFLLYHFESRIAKISPDIFVLIFGGNDFVFYSADEYKKYLTELFEKMAVRFPKCRLLTVTIPPSAKPVYPIRGMIFNTEMDFNEKLGEYNSVLKEISQKFGADCLCLNELFEGVSPEIWRHDEVHLSRVGNDMLYEKLCEMIIPSRI